ncbi:MAG: LPD23 domain-containing protein, partial [Rhodocyclaceae bacterium]
GTLADFNAFDRGAESNFRYGEAENSGGIFFGTSPESVEYYLEGRRGFERGANILPAFVSIRNPASIDDAPRSLAEQARLLHDAEAAGHDGALIGDQVIAFAPGQAKSATGNQGTFDGSNPDIRFSFAGRTAQTADQYALAAAQRRVAMGENAETVRQDTGWHRGDDGRWRFEISDDQARVAVGGANAAEIYDAALLDGEVVRVADVLDHPQLFAAYPHLADVRVELLPAAIRAQARYQHSEHTGAGLLQINPRVKREAMVKTLLHELQHGIQFREGFAQGGSPEAFASDSQEQGADTYRRLAGEVEARNVEARRQMTPEQRRAIAPGYTSDTMPGDVLVTFNGKRIVTPPHNATSRMPMTESGLLRAVRRQFPGLAGNVEVMLARGRQGEKGGLVVLDSADPLQIARVFAEKTGRTLDEAVEMFSKEDGSINGFYDPKSGLTFMVGPNTDPVTAPAVLLHEAVHGQHRAKIDARAMDMLRNREQEQDADLRAFLDRVAQRMVEAGAATDSKEAAPYIVEQAVIEGRSAGYKMADSKFFAWADRTFGKKIGDFLRSVAASLRTWMIRHGRVKALTVDDLVGYAMVGVERAARGAVDGKSKSVSASEGRGKKSVFTPDAYDAQQFASAVDRIAAAENAPRTDLTVGDTPAVLRALGAKALPIQMPSSMIHKANRPAIRGHDVPVAALRNLPALIADPVMVFDSRTEHGAMVALVDARDDSGRPVVVAVHMDAKGGGFHNINKIASIYGKDDIADIERWMAGSLRYYQKEKAPRWLRAVGLQLPEANTIKRLNSRVITDADIVNRPDVSFSRSGLRAAFKRRMPGLSEALDAMLERGEKGQKGGLVLIDSTDPVEIARAFAEKTGRSLADAEAGIRESLRIVRDGVRRVGDFIVPETPEFAGNTSGDLAYLNDKPIRLTVGIHRGSHRGFGIVKLAGESDISKRREPPSYTNDRGENFARHVVAVANSANEVYEETGKTIIWAPRMREALVLEDMGDHWSIVSLRPAPKSVWGRPVQTGRGGFQSLSQRSASAPLLSPGAESAPLPGRQSLGVQTERFDLTDPMPGRQAQQARQDVKVTVKKRRKIDVQHSRNGAIQGFYDTQSGLQFLIAPNVSAQTAPGVILHEAVHGRQDAQLDAKAMRLIQGRAKEQNRTLRSFFNRVAARMEQAGESDNATEAMLPDEGKLADLMHDATLAQIDADSDVKYVEGDDRDQPKPRDGVYRGLAGSEHVQVGGRHNRAGMFGPSPA